MNGELDRDRFEIMNDELCWGIIDFRMLFTGFLALIIDLFADLTVEILFSQVAEVGIYGWVFAGSGVRWVFAGSGGSLGRLGKSWEVARKVGKNWSWLGRLLVSGDLWNR